MKTYFLHYKSIQISKLDKLSGFTIYPVSDIIAQLILGDIDFVRVFLVALLGRFVYSIEIPKWFGFLSTWKQKIAPKKGFRCFFRSEENHYQYNWFGKTVGATLWFHPLWIARHMYVLELSNILFGNTNGVEFIGKSIELGIVSYIGQFPVAFTVNYLIICKVGEKHRFLWSSVFSGLLAIYYAVGKVYF